MPDKKKRSPQEKKALSYAKDRRNDYGENDKASRKAVPARKAKEHRQNRRGAKQAANQLTSMPEEVAEEIESSLIQGVERVGAWKKKPDVPLEKHVATRQARKPS
ncbi:hypothetical protein HK107_10780 [Parvularcula sp. ZS-1/3]|uniref:Uncharacterized protein n=1 Tax=Parvularcula mediterranea TaxID=2732508 RepID=A0A7Y3RMG3_9PROT|nr:hypothetical protein [Parvularcula mediterranea]NNU16802.1 hypothetical protein [Parvularcula mediterranea]